jgi:acyl-CoA synthetase (AMP-forming)/AMP-acid ligase II
VRSPETNFAQYPSTLAHDVARRADRHGARTAVSFTAGDDQWAALSFAELANSAAAISAQLRGLSHPADHPRFVLIMLPNGVDYVRSIYGCFVAGAVAVPFYPPTAMTTRTARMFGERLRQICLDCQPTAIILPAKLTEFVETELPAAHRPALIAAETLPAGEDGEGISRIDARPGDLALLQYTSGSTSRPKGVMVTHANLVHNVHAYGAALGSADGESVATWLPLFHDFGLIGTVLHPLTAGMTVRLTTPAAFIRRPFLWLDIISRSRSTVAMAPNFAFDLCVRSVGEQERSTLDLSCLRSMVNGAEPIRHSTIEAFIKAYERYGFRPSAMLPGYGLAEATLYVAVDDFRREPTFLEVSAARLRDDGVAVPADREPSTVLVSCGVDVADSEIVIVEPTALTACPPGMVGEIWVTGPSVASGYWNAQELSEETFAASLGDDGREFLRTGDLGVKIDGELFVVGRLKDMIIQNGVNHCPQDVEYTAERAHDALQPGGAAVFTVPTDSAEQVIVLCELNGGVEPAAYPVIMTSVRSAIAEAHGLDVATLALVRRGQVPKTTSGKVRRGTSAQRWLAAEFEPLAMWPEPVQARS